MTYYTKRPPLSPNVTLFTEADRLHHLNNPITEGEKWLSERYEATIRWREDTLVENERTMQQYAKRMHVAEKRVAELEAKYEADT